VATATMEWYHPTCSEYESSDEPTDVYGYIEKADENFRVPEDTDTPIILISAGTGFAPMRGFLQEREEQGAKGKNVVYFGCRREADVLYKDELDKWQEDNTEVHYAFSRSDEKEKMYVQDAMKEHKEELWELLEKKEAKIFVCGSGSRVGQGVEEALQELCKENCPDDKDEDEFAEEFMSNLTEEGRYELDVWG